MSAADHRFDVPLEAVNLAISIERAHHHGGRFQWGRETFKNSEEAGASRILYGVEWQGVERHGVYRLMIADNGKGMDDADLVAFFKTYGNSGKAIGGLHENFGQGAKSSLLPWNKHGLAIISYHPDYEDPLMMWLRKDESSGEYGVRVWDGPEGEGVMVVAAHEVDLGNGMQLDFREVAPDFVREGGHGTVLLLLGDHPEQDTIAGDLSKNEHITLDGRRRSAAPGRGLHTYLTKRLWDVGDLQVEVDVFSKGSRRSWPTTPDRGQEKGQWRPALRGVWERIDFRPERTSPRGKIAASDTVHLNDGTQMDWYLWEGERTGMGRDFEKGFIAARYCPPNEGSIDEMFDIADDKRAQAARYRQFGVSDPNVAARLWLIARPPLGGDDGSYGVYMSTDRSQLRIQGGPHASDPLPWATWAEEFAQRMPTEIRDAIAAGRADDPSDPTDDEMRTRLAERFSKRWRMTRLRLRGDGNDRGSSGITGGEPRPSAPLPRRRPSSQRTSGGGGRDGQEPIAKRDPNGQPASPRTVQLGMPQAVWVDPETAADLFAPGMMAIWNKISASNPEGLIQLNPTHPVIEEELTFWKLQYAPHLEDEVERHVLRVYKELAISSVAHSFALKPHVNTVEDHDSFLEPPALTMGLLGLTGAYHIIATRLGPLGKRLPEARTA